MKFPESFLEEVKGRFRPSEYIGRRVALKRSGREWSGLSPFQTEKTPSFFVNDDKMFWADFSSGKTGDIFDFVMQTEGLSFVEAVTRLAEEAGVSMPARDARSDEIDKARRQLEDVLTLAGRYFERQLAAPAGREARAYLERRGLTAEDCSRFGIGYAPNGNCGLRDHLMIERAELRLKQSDLISAGVLVTPDDGRPPYDRYRHRIMFPIRDASGRPVSFGGRALDPAAKAKYLNGPDTVLFDKSRQLYGLDSARKLLAAGSGPLIVVEGYMDVVACQRAGVAACAPMGTSLTESQMDLMWRFHPEPTLCLDADQAGRRAAARAMDQAIPKIGAGRSIRFVTISGAKDPDEVMRNAGPEALRSQLLKSTGLADAIFQREHVAAPLDTPERRADLRERLRKITRAIQDRDLSREYGETFQQKLEALRSQPAQRQASPSSVESARALAASLPPNVAALAYWMVKDPVRVLSSCETLDLGHPQIEPLTRAVVGFLMEGDTDPEALAQSLYASGFGPLVEGLQDRGARLSDPESWRRTYEARRRYLDLEAAVSQAKANITTPEQMENFMTLKAQRDAARKAQ